MRFIDLRSDTVTRPTAGMRKAMAEAEVGDDVWGDDPTVLRLQASAAERFGFEASLFFPSGTQSNLAAMLTWCQRGDEVLLGVEAHTFVHEGGGAAALGSIHSHALANEADGSIDAGLIRRSIKPKDNHYARTRLLALENTLDGKVVPQAKLEAACAVAEQHGLSTHLDGARLMNAVVKTGRSPKELTAPFDSVSLCLSKGLGAPVGSLLFGTAEFIEGARRWRKVLGGGMRQVGLLAAAGAYALEHHVERLAEDHAHAQLLAAELSEVPELVIHPVQTNMVWLELGERVPSGFVERLARHGVLASGDTTVRMVTHLDVSRDDTLAAAKAVRAALRG